MKKYVCPVCGYVHYGEEPPEKCPMCGVPGAKFKVEEATEGKKTWACQHEIGAGKVEDAEVVQGLKDNFMGECTEVGMYLAMSRQAEREGYPEVAEAYKRYAFEEAEHAAKFAELLGEVVYADTKKTNELMAYTYSLLYKMRIIGLRFFTVYGDWNRPDMAMSLFADAMLHDRPIKVFNHGDMLRDFTFVGDIVDGIVRVVEAEHLPLYDIYNIGNHRSEKLLDVIETLAAALGVTPKMEMLPMQPGDVHATYASIDKLRQAVGYEPTTSIREGIPIFAKWYRKYYGL